MTTAPAASPIGVAVAARSSDAAVDAVAGSQAASAVVPILPLDGLALLRDQVRGTFAFNRTSLVGHFIGALVIEIFFSDVAPLELRVGWGAVFYAVWLCRVGLAWRYAIDEPRTARGYAKRLRIWQAGVLAGGALWGAAAWLFHGYGGALHQIGLVLVVYTFCVASVPILAPQFRLFVVFVLLVYLPAIVGVLVTPDPLATELAVLMSVAMGMIVLLGRNYRDSFDRTVELKLRTEALAEQLRAEKVAADAARLEAEIANRAKTQFFTAASHDLRQPLHAMGLFAEALRGRTRDPEAAQLVNSINESVDALEGLFSELLDITRIDSGGVKVEPDSFAIGEIFRKLKLHFEPAAFEKGLSLRFRGQALVADADPLLVERILRNLVSNAIRYTEDGTVLTSARRCGDKIRLQVWDSGPGIPEDQQARVFEEFYQVPGRAVSREQKKGLGLGLAIVSRLAALMQTTVSMRSRVGRGTVFTFELPPGRLARAGVRSGPTKGPVSLTLDGRLIVIVEDEPAVRAGLEVLLRGWGADIVAFDSVDATRAWVASTAADGASPSLVIADYRLEQGETGVAAIGVLRGRFGRGLPAIVATGSTMSGHEQEAHDHDFHVLIKPVVPNKLRAMIAFKLASGGAPTAPAAIQPTGL